MAEQSNGTCGSECFCDGTCEAIDDGSCEAIQAIADFIREAYE